MNPITRQDALSIIANPQTRNEETLIEYYSDLLKDHAYDLEEAVGRAGEMERGWDEALEERDEARQAFEDEKARSLELENEIETCTAQIEDLTAQMQDLIDQLEASQ